MAGEGRDEKGRMLPGNTINPGARPKRAAELIALCQEFSQEAFDTCITILRTGANRDKKWAVEHIHAYAWGRPSQNINLTETSPVADMTYDELLEKKAELLAETYTDLLQKN